MTEGFTLVETLVAISIFSISILSILSVLSQGISNTTYAKEKIIASYLAQEGIEYMRNMRDDYVLYTGNSGWATFKSKLTSCTSAGICGFNNSSLVTDPSFIYNCSPTCKLYVNSGAYNTISSGIDSGFTRTVWMTTTANSEEVKVYSSVSWKQGSGTYNIVFSESLLNWVQ